MNTNNGPASNSNPNNTASPSQIPNGHEKQFNIDLDIFGLKKMWDKAPLEKLSAKHVVFVISLMVFLTYAVIVVWTQPLLRNSLPATILLSIVLLCASWQAFFKK